MNSLKTWTKAAAFGILLISPSLADTQIGDIYVTVEPTPHVRPAPKDKSTLWLKTGRLVTSVLVDAQGRRTGVDPKTFQVVQEIPGSACDVNFSENPYTKEEHAEALERLSFTPAHKGAYQLILQGLQSGPYTIELNSLSLEGSSLPDKNVEGVISEGEQKILKLTFDPAPDSVISLLDVTPTKK